MVQTPEVRRQRSALVLGGLGLALLAAVLCRAYSSWIATRYSPVVAAPMTDLNLADEASLERLPGIGPVLAQRIAGERAARGPFAGFADLRSRVDGVGESLEVVLEGLVTFGR